MPNSLKVHVFQSLYTLICYFGNIFRICFCIQKFYILKMKPFLKENDFYFLSKRVYVKNYALKQSILYFGIVPLIV